ncbi:cytochrome c oxidase subunit 1 [Actinomortierella wolfii]|nr:cytochrome c oxidase subunit 1 [Actinomortierella wolfii]
MYRTFQLSILLYIASSIILQQRYLATENIISGAVRISLKAPHGGVQTHSYCQPPDRPCLYWDADDILYDPNIDGALITTRADVKQIGPWPSSSSFKNTTLPAANIQNQCDVNVPTTAGCDPDKAPVVILTPSSYVADIEEFTLMLEHSIRGQASGVEIRSGNMEYGELIDSVTGLSIQRWDDQSRTAMTHGWDSRNDLHSITTDTSAEPDFSSTTALNADSSRPQKLSGDVLRVGDLLKAANVNLDSLSESPMAATNETIRSAGVVIIVVIQYGAIGWNPNKISYRYMPKAIVDQEYKAIETIRDFQAGRRVEINRHGIKIVFSQHGELGKFSMMTLLTNVVAAIALFKVANILVELTMLRFHPQKRVYGEAKYDSTHGPINSGPSSEGSSGAKVDHLKDATQEKNHPLVDLDDSGDECNVFEQRRGMASDRTLQTAKSHTSQVPSSQLQRHHDTTTLSSMDQARRPNTLDAVSSLKYEAGSRNQKTSEGYSSVETPKLPASKTNTMDTTMTTGAANVIGVSSAADTAATSTTAIATSNSSHLTQLGSRRRPVSSILLQRAAESASNINSIVTKSRERTLRYGGEEGDDIVETRYGAISLSEIRSSGQPLQGFNPGGLVLSPSSPPYSAMSPLTATVAAAPVSGSPTVVESQQCSIMEPTTPRSKVFLYDMKVNSTPQFTPVSPSPVRVASSMAVTAAITTTTPTTHASTIPTKMTQPYSSSTGSSASPQSPPEMVAASPLHVSFGFPRQGSLDNFQDSSSSSPVSVRSPLSISSTPPPTMASVDNSYSASSHGSSSNGKKSSRSNRAAGAARKSATSPRSLNQRAASSPSLMTLGSSISSSVSASQSSTGSSTSSSSSSSSSAPLHHRASHDGLSAMATSRYEALASPSPRSALSFTLGGFSSSLSSPLSSMSPTITPTTILTNIGTTSSTDNPVVTSSPALPSHSLVSSTLSTSAVGGVHQSHNNSNNSYTSSASEIQLRQQEERGKVFKKQKKDNGSPFRSDGGARHQLTIASPQAFSPRRVSSGSIFTSSSTGNADRSGASSPFSSAFTFRSASADPLTDRKKKSMEGINFATPSNENSSSSSGMLVDTKGKSVVFGRSCSYSSNSSNSGAITNGGEWSSLFSTDSSCGPRWANHGFGSSSTTSLTSSSSTSLHTETMHPTGSASMSSSSLFTAWSPFQLSQHSPNYPSNHTGIHPFDMESWTRDTATSSAPSPLIRPYSTRPTPRLSVGGPPPSFTSSLSVNVSSSRPEASRTLRSSASMPTLLQSGGMTDASLKLRIGSIGTSSVSTVGILAQGSNQFTQQSGDDKKEEKEVVDEDEEMEEKEEDEDDGAEEKKDSEEVVGGLAIAPGKDHADTAHGKTRPSDSMQMNSTTARQPNSVSMQSRQLPPLPLAASAGTTSGRNRMALAATSTTMASPLRPHPLLATSSAAASRSMPSLTLRYRSEEGTETTVCDDDDDDSGDEDSEMEEPVVATALSTATIAGTASSSTTDSQGPTGVVGHSSSHSSILTSPSSSSNGWSGQSMSIHQQQQQHPFQADASPSASSSSYSTAKSSPSLASPPGTSSFAASLASRSTSDLLTSTASTLASSTMPLTNMPLTATTTLTSTPPPLSHSASVHLQHFQAQILRHQQKQLQQQAQHHHPGHGYGNHTKREPIAPPASLFFSSPTTAASTSVIPGTGIRVLSRTITMTTAENRKLVLCRSEPLQLCEGVGEEKAARI